ncbi:hypothetical protein AB0I60_13790 [Actinosynnema sp. NPDC050436]|uniref:hypothetical protein n=1 Tax=Actinosynnema sp. NPDC050436 TaxID=3155659 RepID=UPI0033FF449D
MNARREPRPLCDDQGPAEALRELVAADAPGLFAIVEERGVREDASITAWGLDLGDHAEVLSVDGGFRLTAQSPENAVRLFTATGDCAAHLVWVSDDRRGQRLRRDLR